MPYFLRKEYLENFPSFSSKRVAKSKGDGYAAVSARRRRRQGYHAGWFLGPVLPTYIARTQNGAPPQFGKSLSDRKFLY